MKEIFKKVLTPWETEQAISGLAKKLNEMDRADGIFGEEMSVDEMEEVAGGFITTAPTCGVCGYAISNHEPMRTQCPHGRSSAECPFVMKMFKPDPTANPRP